MRQATNDIHQTIDDLIAQRGCLTSHERYNAYLLATLRARGPVEAHLDDSGAEQVFPAWSRRRLVPSLQEDLQDLGLTPLVPDTTPPSQAHLDPPAILGALYVLEGSALGAQILKRRVAAIGFTGSHGARHLEQQTATPRIWASFLESLEAYDFTADDEDRCVQTAVGTFQGFERAYRSMG